MLVELVHVYRNSYIGTRYIRHVRSYNYIYIFTVVTYPVYTSMDTIMQYPWYTPGMYRTKRPGERAPGDGSCRFPNRGRHTLMLPWNVRTMSKPTTV